MDRRIIIIHPSTIVRKGLHAILRDSFPDDFLLLNSIHDLQDYSSLNKLDLILLVNDSFAVEKESYFKKLKDLENNIFSLEICQDKSETESIIGLYDASTDIVKKVKNCIEAQEEKSNELSELSDREQDVLKLVALGFQNKEIAEKLFISIHTVISHRKNITEKLGIKSISGLTVYAILNKLIDTKNIDPSTLI